MRDSVRAYFRTFSEKFEGSVSIMYLDVKGLVTCAIGNLIDPVTLALLLPWAHRGDGTPATRDQVVAEWMRVKADPVGAARGWTHFVSSATLELTPGGVTCAILDRLATNEVFLKKRFPAWEDWPADAQLGTLSIAWAAGPAWVAPKFDGYARAMDFGGCAAESRLDDAGNPGLTPRNAANKTLFWNAEYSRATNQGDTLFYPRVLG